MIELIIVLVIIGLALYLINTYIPMAAPVKTILNVLVILLLCLYILRVFGITDMRLPK
jgi:hypothetical protein